MFEEPREPTHADWLDVFGPRIKTLSKEQDGSANGYAVFLGIIPAGVVVPLHSHEDRETSTSWREPSRSSLAASGIQCRRTASWISIQTNRTLGVM